MDLLIKLLIAHVITDFIIQPDSWVEDKKLKKEKSIFLYIHVILTALVAWVFLFKWQYWWVALVILLSHYVIDLTKIKLGKINVLSFLLDQMAHVLVIIGCSIIIHRNIAFIPDLATQYITSRNLLYLLAYLIVTSPVGYFVGIATQNGEKK